MTPSRVGEFSVIEEVARGGVGLVVRAERDGEQVALKLLDARHRSLFEMEAEALAALADAPEVVSYRAHGEDAGLLWLAMEWLEGDTLAASLRTKGCTSARAIEIGIAIATGLERIHAAGFVHRDLKPSNVICCADGRVMLIDLGIVDRRGVVMDGWAPGTPGYMAPEQARGVGAVDARSDLFALGCILFECITGRGAFVGPGKAATLARVVLHGVPRIGELVPEVQPELEALVAALLDKDPDRRPQDAADVAESLRRVATRRDAPAVRRATEIVGAAEQRVLAIVAARVDAVSDETVVTEVESGQEDDELARIADAHRAQLEHLVDGTSLFVLTDPLAPDLARRAHACGHAVAAQGGVVAIATGRARWDTRWPAGDAVDVAVTMLADAKEGVCVDELTRSLLALDSAPDRRLVGRRGELRILARALRRVTDHRRIEGVVLSGPAGQGKSAIARGFVRRVRRFCRVISTRAAAQTARVPFATIGAVTRQILPLASDVRGVDREALVAVAGRHHELTQPVELEDRVGLALAALLATLDTPTVIVVDDVHWIDAMSLRLFASLVRAAAPVLLLLATRDHGDALAEMEELAVAPLDDASARALFISQASGGAERGDVSDALRKAGGHPLLLEVLARAPRDLADASVLAMLQLRFGALSEAARRVARAAAVFGRSTATGSVRHLLGAALPPDALGGAVAELSRERILEPQHGAELSFSHDLWREAAYALLPDDDRRAGHRLAGAFLVEREAEPAVIAGHFRDGEAPARAAPWFARATARAYRVGDFAVAESLREEIDVALLTDPARAALHGVSGAIALWRGELGTARTESAQALDGIAMSDPQWSHAADIHIQAAGRLGDVAAIAAVAETIGSDPLHLALRCQIARELFRLGDYRAGEEALEAIAPQLAVGGDAVIAAYRSLRAAQSVHRGNYVEVLEHWREALRAYERLQDPMSACATRGEIGFAHYLLGQHERARASTERAVEEAARAHYAHIEAWLWCNLGAIHFEMDDLDAAVAAEGRACELLEQLDDPRLLGSALATLAIAYVELSDDRALESAARACDLLAPYPPMLGLALAARARAELVRGAIDAAKRTVVEGIALIDELGALEEGEMALELTAYEVMRREGRQEQALARVNAALGRLRERAAGIADPKLRESMLRSQRAQRTLLSIAQSAHSSAMPWVFMSR